MKEMLHLSQERRLEILRSVPFFSVFHDAEQRLMVGEQCRVLCYHMGEFLIQEGGKDRSLFTLVAGAASVVKEGSSIPLALLGPGNLFGDVAFLTQRKRTTNVIVHPPPLGVTLDPLALLATCIQDQSGQQDQPGQPTQKPDTAVVLEIRHSILTQLPAATRSLLTDQIIQQLMARVETMHERVLRMTGQDPLLTVDEELLLALSQPQQIISEEQEKTKARIIEQLVDFVEELNGLALGGAFANSA